MRTPCYREIAIRALGHGLDEVRWASVVNVSPGGIGLLLSCPFDTGTLLALELRAGMKAPPASVVGQVVYCKRERHGNAFLGCAFADDLPEDSLLSLLR